MEEALQDAVDEGRIQIPVVEVDFSDQPIVDPESDEVGLFEPIGRVTSLDCYGDEAMSALVEMAIQELETPFAGRVLGQDVQVIGLVSSEANPNDIDFVCEVDGQTCRIAARSVF